MKESRMAHDTWEEDFELANGGVDMCRDHCALFSEARGYKQLLKLLDDNWKKIPAELQQSIQALLTTRR